MDVGGSASGLAAWGGSLREKWSSRLTVDCGTVCGGEDRAEPQISLPVDPRRVEGKILGSDRNNEITETRG